MIASLLTAELWLPQTRAQVFPFFADARNLETLTPPWLQFEVLSPGPFEMRVGLRIDYRLRIHRIPVRWQSEITAWDPPLRFVDEQIRGPYRLWCHEHLFEERDGGTLCIDNVQYRAPGGPFHPWIERFLVRPDVEKIFAFRRQKMLELFPAAPASAPTPA